MRQEGRDRSRHRWHSPIPRAPASTTTTAAPASRSSSVCPGGACITRRSRPRRSACAPAIGCWRWTRAEMGSHGSEDWARAGREILATYAREGDPLQALGRLSPPVPTLHVFAQPRAPDYLAAQEAFARDHPWFAVRRLDAVSHFPTLEVPDATAAAIREFI